MRNKPIKYALSNPKKWACQLFLILLLVSISSSCNKLLDLESRHIVNEANKWQDITDARASLMGVYGLVRNALAQGNAHWLYGDLRQGDFISDNRRDLQSIIQGDLKSSYPLLVQLSNWRNFYAAINAANLFIEKSGAIVQLDNQYNELNHRIDVAQARALKGFCYFQLARIWGDVPIWDKAYEGQFPKIKQSPSTHVLAYAENELKAAAAILPFRYASLLDEIYPVEYYHGYDFTQWDGVLLNRISVNALLAQLTAWSGKYLESAVYTEYVLANAVKSVASFVPNTTLTTADGFFFYSSNSQLVGFPFKWSEMEASVEGHIEQLTLAHPLVSKPVPDMYVPQDQIVAIFPEAGDFRFSFDAQGRPISSYFSEFGSIRPLFSKIKVIRAGSTDGSFPLFSSVIVCTRLEDVALLRAEALYVLGDQQQAKDIVDQLRKARGLKELGTNDNLLEEIFAERRRELMGEGHRWYDQVRYHNIKRNDPVFLKLIHDKGIYWPIAPEVLRQNLELKQNPYWN